jgi:hypothetical protein
LSVSISIHIFAVLEIEFRVSYLLGHVSSSPTKIVVDCFLVYSSMEQSVQLWDVFWAICCCVFFIHWGRNHNWHGSERK